MGGGNNFWAGRDAYISGLSPRGRGKLSRRGGKPCSAGSIPAWAGETRTELAEPYARKVYPRVGGGNHRLHYDMMLRQGLSPRGRGKLDSNSQGSAGNGSIPAWAGETVMGAIVRTASTVYPRVGGGNFRAPPRSAQMRGLSPRGRGKQEKTDATSAPCGSIPAWAGETCSRRRVRVYAGVYPRVGGGNTPKPMPKCAARGLSPRGRGKHPKKSKACRIKGSIPAWAGETGIIGEQRRGRQVYPRVGGGNPLTARLNPSKAGLSPRGRGKPGLSASAAA